jgi:cell division protein FtsQ
MARLSGLGLEKVTISGLSQMRENEVLAAAGLDWRVSLPFLDVNEVRERLERVPLVSSASVRKLYPNELVIGLTERAPHALWQLNGELFIIATDGTVIDLMQDERFTGLPLVVGDRANLRNNDYLTLLEAAGPLKSRIRAGTLVSGRRWNLKMDNGMDVRLPERGAADAVARLVKLEREQKILEKDVLAVDLRIPDRVVVRLTEEAASARADALKQKKMRGKGVDT